MSSHHDSQLSAIAASVDELTRRVAALAELFEGDGQAEPATALFEVERSLQMAERSLDRARRAL